MANKLGESQQQRKQQQQQYDNKIQCNDTSATTITTTIAAEAAATPSGATATSSPPSSSLINHSNTSVPTTDSDLVNQQDNDVRMTIVEKKNFLLEHAKLVAEYYPDYNNMRMTNGPPDVFLDIGLNGLNTNDSTVAPTTTTSITSTVNAGASISSGTTTTTTTTSSSFSFKHFLSNSSRDMTAPSSTVTSLDPIIISNNQQQQQQNGIDINNTGSCNNKSQSSCSMTAISDPTKAFQTSTGARPKIPQTNSVSTTSICTLMNNTRLSDVSAAITDNNNSSSSSSSVAATGGVNIFQNCSTKMKRSPRFSSFDSQASLAEFVGVDSETASIGGSGCGGAGAAYYTAPDAKFQHMLQNDYATSANDIFPSSIHNNAPAGQSIDLMCKLVPRSYSNYDMPFSTTATQRRRVGVFNMDGSNNAEQTNPSIFGCFSKEARPTRLSLNINNKFKFELDPTHNSNGNMHDNQSHNHHDDDGHISRHMEMNSHEIGGVAASALPDFVQDHWLEAWQVQESMRLNSPATSPVEGASGIDAFGACSRGRLAPAKLALIGKPLAAGMNSGASNFCGVIGDKRQTHTSNHNAPSTIANSSLLSRAMSEQLPTSNQNNYHQHEQHDNDNNPRYHNMPLSLGLGDQEMVLVNADIVANATAERNAAANLTQNTTQSNTAGSKMLPDFLADGPIIHSAQRLADVAAGLPPNSIGSPEESSMMTQITNLRLDNERLLRELNETRMALNEQTRRASQLDRQVQQQQQQLQKDRSDASTTTATTTTATDQKNSTNVENKSDNIASSCLNAESEIVALRLHVSDLTTEMDKLRRENAILREVGAVGGGSDGAATGSGGGVGARTQFIGRQPRNQQQFSKDLMRAASNAESNLKQLLTGVENLRQMANEIQTTDWRGANHAEISPDLYTDYYDDCNDPYEEFRTGPAL